MSEELNQGAYSRQLVAIMFTDIEGYTALMQRDESKAVALRNRHRAVFDSTTSRFNGKVLQYYGDGTLSTFSSAIDAVRCAIEMQLAFREDPEIPVRVGIHTGDIIVAEDDVIGDGVNVASRIESLASAGSVLISEKVYDEIKNQQGIESRSLGEFELKNVDRPIEVFAIANAGLEIPERVREDKLKPGAEHPGDRQKRKRLLPSLFFFLIIVSGSVMYMTGLFNGSTGTTDQVSSIAVFPFKTIGGDPEGQYFAEGVREEILNHLTRIEDLNVKSRTVVDRFQDEGSTTEEILSELNVTHYLEGSARKEGNRVRITVQFIDANTDEHLWAENYDREYANIWETQSEIARKVADELKVEITPEVEEIIDKIPTNSPEAWDDFLKSAYYLREYVGMLNDEQFGPKLQEMGLKMYNSIQASIRHDPQFGLGYAFLAYILKDVNPDSTWIYVNKAIQLDPTLSTPYYVRAEHHAYIRNDSIAAVNDFRQAISNGPHMPLPYWHFAIFHRNNGNKPEALRFSFEAIVRQPEPWLLAQMLHAVGWDYMELGDYTKAEYYMDKALVYDPDNLMFLLRKAHLFRVSSQFEKLSSLNTWISEISPTDRGLQEAATYHLLTGDYQGSVENFERYFSDSSRINAHCQGHMYAYALQQLNRDGEAQEWYRIMLDAVKSQPHETPNYELAKIHSASGQADSAMYHLQRSLDENELLLSGLWDFARIDPLFHDIRDLPEFQLILENARKVITENRQQIRKLEREGEIPENLEDFGLL